MLRKRVQQIGLETRFLIALLEILVKNLNIVRILVKAPVCQVLIGVGEQTLLLQFLRKFIQLRRLHVVYNVWRNICLNVDRGHAIVALSLVARVCVIVESLWLVAGYCHNGVTMGTEVTHVLQNCGRTHVYIPFISDVLIHNLLI